MIDRAPSSLLPAKYVVEELVRSVAGKSPSVVHRLVHHLLIEYTIGLPTPCQHPPEAFYLPYYGIDESAIEQTSSGRAIVLAAGSVTALLITLLALLALRRAWERPDGASCATRCGIGDTATERNRGGPRGTAAWTPASDGDGERPDEKDEEDNGVAPGSAIESAGLVLWKEVWSCASSFWLRRFLRLLSYRGHLL